MRIEANLIEFIGDWRYNITMKELSKLNLDYFDDDEHIEEREILKSGKIQVIIEDSIDSNPDPTVAQLNALYYIKNNESSILKSIYECMVQEVVPNLEYKEKVEDLAMFQNIEYKFDSLQKHLGISFLTILLNAKQDHAYYVLDFFFNGYSDWNILTFIIHKNKVISFGDENNDDLRSQILDDGGSHAKHHDFSSQAFRTELAKLHPDTEYFKPLKKYNKLKPWQSYFNEFKLEELLNNSNILEFKRVINDGLIDPNFPFIYMDGGSIINRACLKNKPEFVEFLLSKNVNTKHIHIYSHSLEVYKLNKSASLNFTMAIVEMPIYQSDDNEIVLFPRTTVKTTEIQKINIEIPEGLKLVENSVELIPDNSSSEVSEETKERRKYFTKFWTEYIDQLQLDDPSQSLPNPTRTQNLYIYPGIDKSTWISAYFAQSTGQVGVYYRFSSNQRGQNSREQLYPYLNEIRKELGDKVKWYWDDNINSAFGIVLPLSDVYDQENKKKITGFFNEWVNKFINSIRPRLKQIE